MSLILFESMKLDNLKLGTEKPHLPFPIYFPWSQTYPLKTPFSSVGYSCVTISPKRANTLFNTNFSFPIRSGPTFGALSTTMMASTPVSSTGRS